MWLRAPVALAGDPGSVLNTLTMAHTVITIPGYPMPSFGLHHGHLVYTQGTDIHAGKTSIHMREKQIHFKRLF